MTEDKEELYDYLNNRFHKKVINVLNKEKPTKEDKFFVDRFWEDLKSEHKHRQQEIHRLHTDPNKLAIRDIKKILREQEVYDILCPCNECRGNGI